MMAKTFAVDGDAAKLAGLTVDLMQKVRSGNLRLSELECFLNLSPEDRGAASESPHLLDLSPPFVPSGFTLESHHGEGRVEVVRIDEDLYVGGKKLILYLSPNQQNGKTILGTNLEKEMERKAVQNSSLLKYLLDHTEVIPDSWKGKYIFFWGTKVRDSGGNRGVLYLCWDDDRWDWGHYWLGFQWDGDGPAVLAE